MRVLAAIPARYASTRFPGKPLAKLGGKPILQWVWDALQAHNEEWDAVVATDDERIAQVAREEFGASVMLTSANHRSGTDRCGEVVRRLADEQGKAYDLVINVQGDEPFVDPDQLRQLIATFDDPRVDIATLCTPIHSGDELFSPNNVKVVCNASGNALYFSRSAIPYQRGVDPKEWTKKELYHKHVGIYAYRSSVLEKLCALPANPLEVAESLEQLRWLAAGYTIRVCPTNHANIGIDTPDDLAAAEAALQTKTM